MFIPSYTSSDLQWWLQNIEPSKQSISQRNYKLEIFSDASQTGWGAFCNGTKAKGFWREEEKCLHNNQLEILAAFYATKSFAKGYSNSKLLLRIDNVTAISYNNKTGSTQLDKLEELSNLIWGWCEERNNFGFTSYIASAANYEADVESRSKDIETEYELNSTIFDEITEKSGIPDVDLFASYKNNKCEIYTSWEPDPGSFAVNVFTIDWKPFNFYAFPPFSIITRVLNKIVSDKASRGPYWPAQPWFPLFRQLLTENPIIKGPNKHLLFRAYPGNREIIRRAFMRRNMSETAIPVLIASLSDRTLKVYDGCYAWWWRFCSTKQLNPIDYNLNVLIDQHVVKQSFLFYNQHSQICSGTSIQYEKILKRFLKGVYNIKPSRPKYNETLDAQPVLCRLSQLYPLEKVSLEQLTKKVATLLALTTKHRVQTITKMSIGNIKISDKIVEIRVPEKIKTLGLNKLQPYFTFSYFEEKPELCVAQTVKYYIEKTKFVYLVAKQLLLTFKKPHHPASSQSVSRWIKTMLRDSGINVEIFSAHTTRHASTSAAYRAGVSLHTIKRTASWSETSKIFSTFYNKPLCLDNTEFLRSIVG